MKRKSLEEFNCSWAQTAEAIGDRWSIMIVRDAFYGVSTFSAFEKNLGISKNILTARLEHLVSHEILEKVPASADSPRLAYVLTEKGKALFPVIVAMGQWSDKWVFGYGNEPVVLSDSASGDPIIPVTVNSSDGRELKFEDITISAGQGATESTRMLIDLVNEKR